jgi:hypothetical protein
MFLHGRMLNMDGKYKAVFIGFFFQIYDIKEVMIIPKLIKSNLGNKI